MSKKQEKSTSLYLYSLTHNMS